MTDPAPIQLVPIGRIRTPYEPDGFCPSQPVEREEGESRLELDERFAAGLADLAAFDHLLVLFYLDRSSDYRLRVKPPWAKGREVGLFASRSPRRPSPIGHSVVRLKRIDGSTLITNPIDAWDKTPILDIKPYIPSIDARPGANHGWIEELPDWQHMLEHLRGLPHHHDHHNDDHHHDGNHDDHGHRKH